MELRGLVGNESIHKALSGGLPRSHAWILSGAPGSGRHTLAREMAAAFVCSAPSGQPCGHCAHCRKVQAGIHPDVSPIARFMREEDREKARDVRVDAVRTLRSDAFVRPNEAARKVYLLDKSLSVQDQNALLKLLEEGPEYAVFLILVENPASLLDTVRSRCTELAMSPVPENGAYRYLRARFREKPEDEVRRAAADCGGVLGRAVAALEAEVTEDTVAPWLERWETALLAGQEYPLMEVSVRMQLGFDREALAEFYRRLTARLHAALCASYTGTETPPLARLSRKRLLALEALAEEGRQSCAFYIATGQSLGWFAARCWELLKP